MYSIICILFFSSFILLQVVDQFSQHHLLKRLSFLHCTFLPTFGVEHGMVCGFIAGGDNALRFSVENSEDSAELGLADLKTFNPTPDDVVVGISANGGPRYVLTILEQARQAGCKTIGISSNPEAKLQRFSDIFINPVVGEEALTGSSRMKSGTAQKMILNMLPTHRQASAPGIY